MGLACVFIGLVIRVLVTYLLVHFGGFSLKEKLFISIAWLPKATVQVGVCLHHLEKSNYLTTIRPRFLFLALIGQ